MPPAPPWVVNVFAQEATKMRDGWGALIVVLDYRHRHITRLVHHKVH